MKDNKSTLYLFALLLLFSTGVTACTTEAEEQQFTGRYLLYENEKLVEETFLNIKGNHSFSTNYGRFGCEKGTWDVSAFPTILGLVITFNANGETFCNQMHWDEGYELGVVLVSQETEEKYRVRFMKTTPVR